MFKGGSGSLYGKTKSQAGVVGAADSGTGFSNYNALFSTSGHTFYIDLLGKQQWIVMGEIKQGAMSLYTRHFSLSFKFEIVPERLCQYIIVLVGKGIFINIRS